MKRKKTAETTITRKQITKRDHSGLSTYSLNLRISTMMAEVKNRQAESDDAASVIKANTPVINNLKIDIAAMEELVEARR